MYLPGLMSCSALKAKISDAAKKPKEITVHPEEEMSGNATLKSYPVRAPRCGHSMKVEGLSAPSHSVDHGQPISHSLRDKTSLQPGNMTLQSVQVLGQRCYSLSP